MRILPSLLSLALASTVVTGCTTKKYYTTTGTDGGTTTGGPASVANLSPNNAFAGRTLDVQIAGSDTSWDASTTVDFGADIKVNKVTLGSASALTANITVAPTAASGARDVTVKAGSDSEAFKMTFTVTPAVSIKVSGKPAQGSIFELIITNNDPIFHPFDTTTDQSGNFTNINITAPQGVSISPSTVTASEVDALVFVDVKAAAGDLDLDLVSGADPTTGFEYQYPKAFTIAAQTATTLAHNTTVALADPFESKLYTYTPTAAGNFLSFTASDTTGSAIAVVLDSTGSFANASILGFGQSVDLTAKDTSQVYVVIWDQQGMGGLSVTADFLDVTRNVQAGGEGTDTGVTSNDTIAKAVALTAPPVLVKDASLSSASDIDNYKITVTAGQKIRAVTTAPASGVDAGTLTFVQFLDATGNPIADASGSTDPSQTSSGMSDDTTGALTAGTYYIQITWGGGFFDTFDTANTHYDLTVLVQ